MKESRFITDIDFAPRSATVVDEQQPRRVAAEEHAGHVEGDPVASLRRRQGWVVALGVGTWLGMTFSDSDTTTYEMRPVSLVSDRLLVFQSADIARGYCQDWRDGHPPPNKSTAFPFVEDLQTALRAYERSQLIAGIPSTHTTNN